MIVAQRQQAKQSTQLNILNVKSNEAIYICSLCMCCMYRKRISLSPRRHNVVVVVVVVVVVHSVHVEAWVIDVRLDHRAELLEAQLPVVRTVSDGHQVIHRQLVQLDLAQEVSQLLLRQFPVVV